MRITVHGAAREVTGSCYLIETDKTRVLLDCGMFQGSAFVEAKNFAPFGFDPSTVDALIVTHAHLDHTGRIPKLVKEGFRGKIYLTPPTAPLTKIVLEDAYQIMRDDFKRHYKPFLYEEEDIAQTVERFVPVDYTHAVTIGDVTFRFREAGHIFGSAFVELHEKNGVHVTFSGDIGNEHTPILRDTAQLAKTDVLFLESTYGNRVHEDESTRELRLKDVVTRTAKNNGVLIIPAFAIERTQQLLYELNHLVENNLIPQVDTYLDSPMAIRATEVIDAFPQYYDAEALRLVSKGDDLFNFTGLHLCPTREESKQINEAPRPKIIIAGAGMMNGGRILHHLVRYLSDKKSTVLIVGYQSSGTLGRKLYRGEKVVDVMSEQVHVHATIESIGAYSAHADQQMLLRWVKDAEALPGHIYCTHGDEGACAALATELQTELGAVTDVPRFGDTITL
ncbi:MAG: MBL fold metallo-hydrolase [Patescibacteria group bacterium]